RLEVANAWELSRRRFWAFCALGALGTIPIGLVALATDAMWPSFDSLMDAITGPRERMPPLATAAIAVQRAQQWLVPRVLIDFLTTMVYAAVAVALVSYSYKALTGHRPEDRLTPKWD